MIKSNCNRFNFIENVMLIYHNKVQVSPIEHTHSDVNGNKTYLGLSLQKIPN